MSTGGYRLLAHKGHIDVDVDIHSASAGRSVLAWRRWLALVDALAWPMLGAVAIAKVPFDTGLVGVAA